MRWTPWALLVIKSRFLPRLLGILLILDGFAEMIWFIQALLLPAYPAIKVPGTVVSLLAEVGLALWLLIKGVSSSAPASAWMRRACRAGLMANAPVTSKDRTA